MAISKKNLRSLRIGYVPYSDELNKPGDRRRFVYYANKRDIKFEIADPNKQYDLVVLSARADISVWGHYPDARIVYDLIDSYLAIPRTNWKGRLRGLSKFLFRQSRFLQLDYWKAIELMCARADAVVCSTIEQQIDILNFCSNVHVILDAQMHVSRVVKTDYHAGTTFRIVWEGLPQTIRSLQIVRPVMARLSEKYNLEVHVVSDPEHFRYLGQYGKSDTLKVVNRILPKVRFHKWSEADCAEIITSCDLAIIPLALDDPFASGKPENKLLLFWRMAMPVVTSASPAYVRAMQAAGINLTARDEDEWVIMLERLLGSEATRRMSGALGKTYADREFSESSLLEKWDSVFTSLGFSTD